MSALSRLLSAFAKRAPAPPPIDPTDDIIPVHLFDDTAATRSIVLVWTFRFDNVLDPDKLNAALCDLFQMDGWRRFGGRFRYQANGRLEIHVPISFSDERPAVYYTQERHPYGILQHPLASKLPQSQGKLAVHPGPKEFCSLGLGPGTPRTIDDFVLTAKPQFCLHVQTFTDATLVSVTHSHVSTDLMGWAAMIKAWSLVLAGRQEAVTPLADNQKDIFDSVQDASRHRRHVLADSVMGGWAIKYWGLRSMVESWWYRDGRSRTLCIPAHVLSRLMETAQRDLSTTSDDCNSASGSSFISEGDVLTAVACRTLAYHYRTTPERTLTTILAVDPRSRLRSIFDHHTAHVLNSPTNLYFIRRAGDILNLSLGELARSVREAIDEQATEEQLKASIVLSRRSMRTTNMPVIFGDKDMAAQFMSNWSKGMLAEEMDFSPAIIQESPRADQKSRRGHPIYLQASDPGHSTVSVISSVFVVMQKDLVGDTWLSIALPTGMWTALMDYLEQYT